MGPKYYGRLNAKMTEQQEFAKALEECKDDLLKAIEPIVLPVLDWLARILGDGR